MYLSQDTQRRKNSTCYVEEILYVIPVDIIFTDGVTNLEGYVEKLLP